MLFWWLTSSKASSWGPRIPKESVKGRKRDRILVCNKVAKQVVDAQRGIHEEYVFTYQDHRVETMNNSAWQRARRLAGLGGLHVHDLRHTVGMRLREAEIREETTSDILWHNPSKHDCSLLCSSSI